MLLVAGSRLNSYEIVEPLGAGGMGEVYRARDTSLKRDVAVKVVRDSWSRDPDRLRRFELEAQATAALNHPNIVSIFHVGEYKGSPYIVTELPAGRNPCVIAFAVAPCVCGRPAISQWIWRVGWLPLTTPELFIVI